MRSVKANVIASENIEKCTVCVTVDKKLFEYKTKEEIAEMIEKEICNAINKSLPLNNVKCRFYSLPLNNVKCRFYSFEGRCLGEKWAPVCYVCGDVSRCKLLKQ